MKALIASLVFSLMSTTVLGGELLKVVPVTYSQLMKKALEAKDAPATCWYLGVSQGYLRALKDLGNSNAAKLMSQIQSSEGKCGGKNSMDLKLTFTPEEWSRLSALQNKIETTEL